MQKVEGSNPFIRSFFRRFRGDVAEWLGTGLQNPLHRFNSDRRLLSGGATPVDPPAGTPLRPILSLASEEQRLYHDGPDGRLAQGESASLTRKRP
jgi:hypothetical protein